MRDTRTERLRRRAVSVTAVSVAAVSLTLTAPLWVAGGALVDLALARRRLPTVRLLAFGTAWCWLEVAGVSRAVGLWLIGRAADRDAHYALQRWWITRLMGALRRTTGIRVDATGAECLSPGPVVMVCRHVSLADSLLSAWVISDVARMNPHYVLKRELLSVPNLDVVGNRLPNCFIDRDADDAQAELDRLRAAAGQLGPSDVMVIFPEGTRATPAKRARAVDKIAVVSPHRAEVVGRLRHLLPPRPGGTLAILAGQPEADVVVAWHAGFDGMDSFGGIHRALRRPPPPVRFRMERIARHQLPADDQLEAWLDDLWVDTDQRIDQLHSEAP